MPSKKRFLVWKAFVSSIYFSPQNNSATSWTFVIDTQLVHNHFALPSRFLDIHAGSKFAWLDY